MKIFVVAYLPETFSSNNDSSEEESWKEAIKHSLAKVFVRNLFSPCGWKLQLFQFCWLSNFLNSRLDISWNAPILLRVFFVNSYKFFERSRSKNFKSILVKGLRHYD